MKYYVLESFKAQTKGGELELKGGQLITLPKEMAVRLLNEGKITPAERVAYKVYSEILQAYLWVVYGPEDMAALRAQGIPEAIYTGKDLEELKKLPKEHLRTIHEVKTIFHSSCIEEITPKKETDNGKEFKCTG